MKVNYKPVGDNLPTVLSTAVAGGKPPDMADIAQPGLVKQFVDKGALKPIAYARKTLLANFAPSWVALGTFNGKIYGLVFKASNKSTVWYNVHAFKNAGVKAPATWPQLTSAANTIKASGVPPYSIGGADGWTLTDLFENIYLRQAGPGEVRAALGPQDQVDGPVGHRGAEDDGAGVRRLGEHGRRHLGRRADGLPDVGQQRLPEPAEGGDGDRGRLRPGRRDREGEAGNGLRRVRRSRRSTARRRRS